MKDVEKFKKYLEERGAVVLPPTNPWEVVRFRSSTGITSVVYENKRGELTFTGESATAYKFFKSGRKWVSQDRKRENLRGLKTELANRDGQKCFFHGEELPLDKLTVEHLLEFSKGGYNHPFNLCLACEDCNKAVVGMSIAEKMLYRDHVRRNGLPFDEAGHYDASNIELPKNGKVILEVTPSGENFFHKIFKGKK